MKGRGLLRCKTAFFAVLMGVCDAADPQFSFGGIGVEAGSVAGERRHGVFEEAVDGGRKVLVAVPAVEIRIRAAENASARGLMAKVYFFDADRRLLHVAGEPVPAYVNTRAPYGMPDLFPKGRMQSLFFPIPENLRGDLRGGKWTAVAVFGNETRVIAEAYPATRRVGDFDFPERSLMAIGGAGRSATGRGEATPIDGSFVEYVAQTRSKAQPQITMFFRLPPGVSKVSELNGLLGRVVLGRSVDDVREQFLREAGEPKPGTSLALAQKYKLGLLYWGARTSWTKTENADALPPAQRRAENMEFDLVAEGWLKGLDELAAKHGIPNRNIILEGESQAGQWSHRLALRAPDRILAVHTHIASSYGEPVPEGARTMWLVTTGEQENGCENSIDFYEACRRLRYPIIFKAEPALGHQNSRLTEKLRYQFFDFVLRIAEASGFDGRRTREQCFEAFRKSEYFGDWENQMVVPAPEREEIDPMNQVPLPTVEIAEAWNDGKVR